MTSPRAAPPKGFRRLERWLVGLALAVVAFLLERVVTRAIRRQGAVPEEEADVTTFTSKGGEVDLPE